MFFGRLAILTSELTQKRPLPIGVKDFNEWSDRIIAGAMLPATPESQKFALAAMLIDLPPTVGFEADVYFIHRLRKGAVNQVAQHMMAEIKAERQKQNQAAVTAPAGEGGKVLENAPI